MEIHVNAHFSHIKHLYALEQGSSNWGSQKGSMGVAGLGEKKRNATAN